MNKQVIVQGRLPARFMPYPSIEFVVPQKSKDLTPTGLVLVQINLQSIYKEIRKTMCRTYIMTGNKLRFPWPNHDKAQVYEVLNTL